MPLRFRLRPTDNLPIEVAGILPETCANRTMVEVERLPVLHGNRTVPLAELFTITGSVDANHHVWEGDLTTVHWLGARLTQGTIEVHGHLGRHVGSQMDGGTVDVYGHVGDWAGAEMRGGLLRVRGNAGNQLGAAYRGSPRGMTDGTILVAGDAGHETAHSMRRGLIAVGGACGDLAGFHMLAGTLLVLGRCGKRPGAAMRRGSLALLGPEPPRMLPSFRHACQFQPLALQLVYRHLDRLQFAVPDAIRTTPCALYNGDLLYGGRGEILVPAGQ